MATGFVVGRWLKMYPIEAAHHQRNPQRPGRYWRRRDSDGGKSHGVDAVCSSSHAHRRRDHRNIGINRTQPHQLIQRRSAHSEACHRDQPAS